MPLRHALALATCVSALACTGGKVDPADSGAETGEPAIEESRGLPEGQSTWTGSGQVSGVPVQLSLALTNTDGDLSGTVTVSDDPSAPIGLGEGTFSITGAHDAGSGEVAVGPVAWVAQPAIEIELLGATGRFDLDAGTLSGQLRDWASASDNSLQGGPFSLTLDSGDGDPTPVGDAAQALPAGGATFAGSMQCTGAVREVSGELSVDADGVVTGSMTVGDTALDTPLGTFGFDGVANASTGALVILPLIWDDPAPSTLTFGIAGRYDAASGAWTGDQLTNTAACPAGTWQVTVEAR